MTWAKLSMLQMFFSFLPLGVCVCVCEWCGHLWHYEVYWTINTLSHHMPESRLSHSDSLAGSYICYLFLTLFFPGPISISLLTPNRNFSLSPPTPSLIVFESWETFLRKRYIWSINTSCFLKEMSGVVWLQSEFEPMIHRGQKSQWLSSPFSACINCFLAYSVV